MKIELTQGIVKELLHYEPDTGVFTWRERDIRWFRDIRSRNKWNTRYAGRKAGHEQMFSGGKSYILMTVLNKHYLAHRLAHLYVRGAFPKFEVDHENGCGTDNRWLNIEREVTHEENGKNIRRRSDNTTGVPGVYWVRHFEKWQSRIRGASLGYFENFEDAVAARKQAEIDLGFHKNHGQERPL